MSEQEMRLVDRRCSSCEHEWRFHQTDGCWYSVTLGRKGRDSGCPCAQPRPNRVPQPGDRVFGWAGRPFGTVHGFVVADEITNAAGFIAVKAPAVATPYAVDPTTVEVIEPAPCAPKAGVDYCGATHPDYGECFLDVDTEEHAHGHESETGRWPVTDSRPADTGKETDRG